MYPQPIIVEDGLTRVAILSLGAVPSGQRRRREGQALQRLLPLMCGQQASLTHDADGAPYASGSTLNISISHSRLYAALAVNPIDAIGIDLEQPRQQLQRVKGRFLHPQDHPAWTDRLLEAWTAKEAVFKAAHIHGLTSDGISLCRPDDALARVGTQTFALTWLTPPLPEPHCLCIATPM